MGESTFSIGEGAKTTQYWKEKSWWNWKYEPYKHFVNERNNLLVAWKNFEHPTRTINIQKRYELITWNNNYFLDFWKLCSFYWYLGWFEDSMLIRRWLSRVVRIMLMLTLWHWFSHILHFCTFEVSLGGVGSLLIHFGPAPRLVTEVATGWHD